MTPNQYRLREISTRLEEIQRELPQVAHTPTESKLLGEVEKLLEEETVLVVTADREARR